MERNQLLAGTAARLFHHVDVNLLADSQRYLPPRRAQQSGAITQTQHMPWTRARTGAPQKLTPVRRICNATSRRRLV